MAGTPSGNAMTVPPQHWEDLEQKDGDRLCENTRSLKHPTAGLLLPFLKEHLLVDPKTRGLFRQRHGHWHRVDNPLLELLCLSYLLNAGPEVPSGTMVGVREFKAAHFFQGPHELNIRPLLDRYGNDLDGFKSTALHVGGEAMDMADAAFKFPAFPKVPLYYLLWEGDQEFRPRLSILFDATVECHLKADSIWGLVNLVSDILLMGTGEALF